MAMALTPDQVRALASQARLGLADDEAERISEQLTDVLAVAARLRELDLDDVEPTLQGASLVNVMRDDAVQPSLPRDAALAAAPEVEDGFVKVPRVVEE